MTYTILVPIDPNQSNGIAGGSGIVASTEALLNPDENMVRVYYEGNMNHACNLDTLYDRVLVAVGRMHARYPTVAFTVIHKNDYLPVGEFEYDGFKMKINQQNINDVNDWLNHDPRMVTIYNT